MQHTEQYLIMLYKYVYLNIGVQMLQGKLMTFYWLDTVDDSSTSDNFRPFFLLQIFMKMQIQGQFWNLHILRILKHPQNVEIDQVLPKIFKVKDNWYQSQNFQ